MTDDVNPFDQFDNWVDPNAKLASGTLEPGPPPSLMERFQANRDASYYTSTLSGAIQGKYAEKFDRELALRRYESFPQWETPLDGLAALSGQLVGGASSFENLFGVGIGARALEWAGIKTAPWVARTAAGAIDAGVINAGTDVAVQGIELGAGTRDSFDPAQVAIDAGLGAVTGGLLAGAGHGIGRLLDQEPQALADFSAEGPLPLPKAQYSPGAARQPPQMTMGGKVTGELVQPRIIALPEGPTLGERLDAQAREVRQLPERAAPPDLMAGVYDTVRKSLGPQPKGRMATDIVQFLSSQGGLKDSGGELAARDLHKVFVPGHGRLVRKNGLSLDEARHRAVQAGYLTDTPWEGGVSVSTVDDLVQAIERNRGGDRVFAGRDAIDMAALQEQKQLFDQHIHLLERSIAEIRDQLTDDIPHEIKVRAVELRMADDRLDPADALERAIMEDYYGQGDAPTTLKDDAGNDIPFEALDEPANSAGQRGDAQGAGPARTGPGEAGAHAQDGGRADSGGGLARADSGADGKPQLVIPGAERIGSGQLAQRLADAPLRPDAPQKLQMGEGLFGDGHLQDDFFSAPVAGGRTGSLVRDPAGVASTGAAPQLKRLKDVAEELASALDATAVRMGRVSAKVGRQKAGGQYGIRSGVIRLAKPDDFDVLAHELGHHLEAAIGAPVKTLMKSHAGELLPLAYAGAKKGTELEEGYAEFVRLMVTNPVYAARSAPQFDAAFRALLAKDHREVGKAINDAAAAWRQWLERPSSDAVASTIVSTAEPKYFAKARKDLDRMGLGATIADRLARGYALLLDDLSPLANAAKELQRVYLANTGQALDLKVSEDPYKLARMSRGAWNAGHMDINNGVFPYRGTKPVSASLRDALILAMGKPNVLSRWDQNLAQRFGAYLWSRRALGEWDRFRAGLIPNPPDKLTAADHARNVTEMEAAHPQFATAAQQVYDWGRAMWAKKRDAGLITNAQYQDGLKIKDYVPGLRAFDQAGDAAKAVGSGKEAKGGFVRRFQGSRRDVINPVESMVADAYETAMAIARNDVVKSLDRLARRAGPGGGAIAERIPSHELRATMIDPLEAVTNAGRSAGLDTADITVLRDTVEASIGDEKAAIFRPAIINEKGEAIAFWRDGGELKALRLADGQFGKDMYRALTMMTRHENNLFINLLSKPAALLRLGITASPEFLLANFIRDQATSMIFYGKPLSRLASTVSGMGDDLLSREAARQYSAMGGLMGGAQVASLADVRVRRDLKELRRKGWIAEHISLKGLLQATELSETGMRLGLFKSFTAEARARGLSEHEAMLEGAWRARDHLDFDRRGSAMTGIARLIPFLSASLQGLDKTSRHMIAPLFGKALTAADKHARAEALKSWARLSALTVATMGLHALMSQNEDYRDLSPQTKATHWMIKLGDKWLAVPKPFELGAILNLGPAAYDAMARQDPRWADEYMQGLYEVAMPPNVMEGNPTIATAYELASGKNLRTGADIVPEQLQGMEPWMQFTSRTSEISRTIGKAINVSPAVIDHLLTAHGGNMGRNVLALADYAASDKPLPGWDDMPITRRFIKDASRGASSSRAFWGLISQKTGSLEGARKSWQAMMDNGDTSGADDYLAAQPEIVHNWIAASSLKPEARRLHPMIRAREAVLAILDLERDISDEKVRTAAGEVIVSRADRGAAEDILQTLAMAEARNALVLMGEPGWNGRKPMDVTTWHRELEAVSPDLRQALADRFAARKVLPFDTVSAAWPDYRDRLRRDGSEAEMADLVGAAKADGYELDGEPIKRKPRAAVPGLP